MWPYWPQMPARPRLLRFIFIALTRGACIPGNGCENRIRLTKRGCEDGLNDRGGYRELSGNGKPAAVVEVCGWPHPASSRLRRRRAEVRYSEDARTGVSRRSPNQDS